MSQAMTIPRLVPTRSAEHALERQTDLKWAECRFVCERPRYVCPGAGYRHSSQAASFRRPSSSKGSDCEVSGRPPLHNQLL